jgi:hypothetical protein
MGRMKQYLEMVTQSRLLCPNLKEMTLRVYTGNTHRGNSVARMVVRDHLLALRWCNPNAVIYLREARGQGTPTVEYELWKPARASKVVPIGTITEPAIDGKTLEQVSESVTVTRQVGRFEISHALTPEEVVAKVMMAGRDPEDDDHLSSRKEAALKPDEKVNLQTNSPVKAVVSEKEMR